MIEDVRARFDELFGRRYPSEAPESAALVDGIGVIAKSKRHSGRPTRSCAGCSPAGVDHRSDREELDPDKCNRGRNELTLPSIACLVHISINDIAWCTP